jgi:hypothetical protein
MLTNYNSSSRRIRFTSGTIWDTAIPLTRDVLPMKNLMILLGVCVHSIKPRASISMDIVVRSVGGNSTVRALLYITNTTVNRQYQIADKTLSVQAKMMRENLFRNTRFRIFNAAYQTGMERIMDVYGIS